MSTLTLNTEPLAVDVAFEADLFRIKLDDGRELAAPIEWFPRLRAATSAQRSNWRLIGVGEGVHWPDIDEDISIRGLLAGFSGASRRVAAE